MDVVAGEIFDGALIIADGKICAVERGGDVPDRYLLPGLIDAHVHIESSLLLPTEFARLAVVHGSVGAVSDPHEIANVAGIEGIRFMLRNAARTPFHFCFGAPSCVPATPFESSGAVLGLPETETMLAMPEIGYLAEMMNYPAVICHDPQVHAKLELARRFGKPVDGHAPGLRGSEAEEYARAGITTDHECFSLEEAREKIGYGMQILIREGSSARNFEDLAPLLSSHPGRVMFCSDDKHPDDLLHGHMDSLVRRGIAAGYDPLAVLRACTLNPVRHYRLKAGLLQPGDPADYIVTDNLHDLTILTTVINGEVVAEHGRSLLPTLDETAINSFETSPITPEQLRVPCRPGLLNVIEACDGELITGWLRLEPTVRQGAVVSDPQRDILKIVVLNRHAVSQPAVAFIRGFGLRKGALASTVAHDSHNIICIGTSDTVMTEAINLLIESKGGIAVLHDGEQLLLPLPVGGLMSGGDGYRVAARYHELNSRARDLGCRLAAPFMTLSFMALLVIPNLKLSDRGLFDSRSGEFTDLFTEESQQESR